MMLLIRAVRFETLVAPLKVASNESITQSAMQLEGLTFQRLRESSHRRQRPSRLTAHACGQFPSKEFFVAYSHPVCDRKTTPAEHLNRRLISSPHRLARVQVPPTG